MRYQLCYNRSVHNLPKFRLRNYVYVHRPPTLKAAAGKVVEEQHSKFLPKAVDPVLITVITSHTIKIDEKGGTNMIWIN